MLKLSIGADVKPINAPYNGQFHYSLIQAYDKADVFDKIKKDLLNLNNILNYYVHIEFEENLPGYFKSGYRIYVAFNLN